MTMSHPSAISPRCNLNISRNRRRIRLRRTAFPTAFLMLQPNRLIWRSFGRRKTVNSRLVRRRPWLYTASYSARCSSLQVRGNPSRLASDAREAVTPLLAAACKDFSSTCALHTCAKTVLLMTASHMRLIRPLRQRCFSCRLFERDSTLSRNYPARKARSQPPEGVALPSSFKTLKPRDTTSGALLYAKLND